MVKYTLNRLKLLFNYKNYILWFLVFVMVIAQVVWVVFLDFPPTSEQLNIGIGNPLLLWLTRTGSLVALLLATHIFSKILDRKVSIYFWLLITISPFFSILWMSHPLESLKITLISLIIYAFHRKKINLIFSIVISLCILVSINSILLHEKPSILSTLSLPQSQKEVMERMRIEDITDPKVPVPQLMRRIAYNKYFISLKNTANQALYFFDGEVLFFQETSSTELKAPVFFYWPEVFLFVFSLWILIAKSGFIANRLLVVTIFVAFINFILSNSSIHLRLSVMLWVISLVMAIGLGYLINSRRSWHKVFIYSFVLLIFYGISSNQYDRYMRPQFWLDNRPVAYKWLFESAQKYNYQNYQKVYLTDVLGNAKNYCEYFLSDCSNFAFVSFDLSKTAIEANTLYLGFSGNFYGKVEYSEYSEHSSYDLFYMGLTPLSRYKIRDNIANGYGQELIVSASNLQR